MNKIIISKLNNDENKIELLKYFNFPCIRRCYEEKA